MNRENPANHSALLNPHPPAADAAKKQIPISNEDSGLFWNLSNSSFDKIVRQGRKPGEVDGGHVIRIAAAFQIHELIKNAKAFAVSDQRGDANISQLFDLFVPFKFEGALYRMRIKGKQIKGWKNKAHSMRVDDVLIQKTPEKGEVDQSRKNDIEPGNSGDALTIREMFAGVNPYSGSTFSIAPPPDSPAFKNWFGDSKVVDENGEPLVVYHGTPDANFNEFKEGSHFTENPDYAANYLNPSASSMGKAGVSRESAPAIYPVYLSIKNPFNLRDNSEHRKLYEEFTFSYGNGTPLSDKGLPDWTDSLNLLEWIEETGQPFDGLILDEGGTPEGGWRGISWVPVSPTQIKSATGNRGTFDPNDPRITYSIGLPLEVASRIERAAVTKPLELEAGASKSDITKDLFESTLEMLKSGVRNSDTGRIVTTDRKKLKHVESNVNAPVRVAAFKQVEEVLKKAIWLTGAKPDSRIRRKKFPPESRFHYLALPIEYEKKSFLVMLAVQKDDKGRNLYNIQDFDIKETPGSLVGIKSTATEGKNPMDSAQTIIEDFVKRKSNLIDSQATFSIAPPPDSPAFKNWFGDSKVVDENGEPLVVYHTGTMGDVYDMTQSRSWDGEPDYELPGIYLSESLEDSAAYGTPDEVKELYVTIRNPYEGNLTQLHEEHGTWRKAMDWLIEQGFDGVIDDELGEGFREFIAFSPTQIKSATGNRGTFDPNDPRITYSIGLPLEVASRIERAATTKPLELEAVQDADKATVRKAAAARAKELFKDGIVNQDTGRVVTLSGESWRELKTFTASPEKVAVLQRIDDTVKGAVWLTGAHVDNRPGKAKFKELGGKYHYLAMPVKIGKDSGVALLVVQKDSSGRNLYQINEVSIKKASDKIDPDHKSGDSAEALPTSGHIRTIIEDFIKRKSNLIDSQATFSIGLPADEDGGMRSHRKRTPR